MANGTGSVTFTKPTAWVVNNCAVNDAAITQ